MPITFTFALSQQQTFELRCDYGSRRLDKVELFLSSPATLSNMAGLIAQREDIEGAIALYQQSLEIDERINNVQGKAVTLHEMAYLIAQREDIEGAIALYQQSLEIDERINNIQGKAATLASMAYLAGKTDEFV
jgi:tetratricopeptide (TPR) repeat protein